MSRENVELVMSLYRAAEDRRYDMAKVYCGNGGNSLAGAAAQT